MCWLNVHSKIMNKGRVIWKVFAWAFILISWFRSSFSDMSESESILAPLKSRNTLNKRSAERAAPLYRIRLTKRLSMLDRTLRTVPIIKRPIPTHKSILLLFGLLAFSLNMNTFLSVVFWIIELFKPIGIIKLTENNKKNNQCIQTRLQI